MYKITDVTKEDKDSTVKRSVVGLGRHRSANLTPEGYPPRDGPSSECHFPLPRMHHGYFNKNTVIFMLNFSIIL